MGNTKKCAQIIGKENQYLHYLRGTAFSILMLREKKFISQNGICEIWYSDATYQKGIQKMCILLKGIVPQKDCY